MHVSTNRILPNECETGLYFSVSYYIECCLNCVVLHCKIKKKQIPN